MADAPNTSSYVLITADTSDLPNSRTVFVQPNCGVTVTDFGAGNDLVYDTNQSLKALQLINRSGFMASTNNTGNYFEPRNLISSDNSLTINNSNGLLGNPDFSVNDNVSIQNTQFFFGGDEQATTSKLQLVPIGGIGITPSLDTINNIMNYYIYATPGETGGLEFQLNDTTVGVGTALNLLQGSNITITGTLLDGVMSYRIDASGGGGGAPTNSTYLCQTSASLPANGINLGAANAQLAIGKPTPVCPVDILSTNLIPINVVNTSSNGGTECQITNFSGSNAANSGWYFQSARGTVGAPAALQANDVVGGLRFLAHDGSTFITSATILAVATATVSPSNHSTALTFHTSNSTTRALALTLNPDQTATFTQAVTMPSGGVLGGTFSGTATLSGALTLTGNDVFSNASGTQTVTIGNGTNATNLIIANASNFTVSAGATATFSASSLPIFNSLAAFNAGATIGDTFGTPLLVISSAATLRVSTGATANFLSGSTVTFASTPTFNLGATVAAGTFSISSGATFALPSGALWRLNGNLPASGNIPTYDGTNIVWSAPVGTGTVTSVAVSSSDAFIGVSGSPITSSGTIALTIGTLGETKGGTNQTTYATGDTLYASNTNTLSKLSAGAPGTINVIAAGVPSWSNTLPNNYSFTGTPVFGAGATVSAGTFSISSGATFALPSGALWRLNGNLPASGNVPTYNGTNIIWAAPATSGTVTSVGLSSPDITIGGSASPITSSGAWTLTLNTVPATKGGTGITSFAVGDMIYADTTTSLARLTPIAAQGSLLLSTGTLPAWGNTIGGTTALTIGATSVSKAVNIIGTGTVTIGANTVNQPLNLLGTGTLTIGDGTDTKAVNFAANVTASFASAPALSNGMTLSAGTITATYAGSTIGYRALYPNASTQLGQNALMRLDNYDSGGTGAAIILKQASGTRVSPTATANNATLGDIDFYGYTTSDIITARIECKAGQAYTTGNTGSYIDFFTTVNGSSVLARRMGITSAGAVEIVNLTSVGGTTSFSGTPAFTNGASLSGGVFAMSSTSSLTLGATNTLTVASGATTTFSNNPSFANATFVSGGQIFCSGTLAYGAAVNSFTTGLFLPSNQVFSINSAAYINAAASSAASNMAIGLIRIGAFGAPTHALEVQTDDAVKPGVGGLWTVASDARIKRNIEDIDGTLALTTIRALRPRKYQYTQEHASAISSQMEEGQENPCCPHTPEYGFVADEVELVMPECVSVSKNCSGEHENIKMINMGAASALLYKSIDVLAAQIEELSAQNTALLARIEALEAAA